MPLDTPLSVTDRLFFSELDRTGSERILRGALAGAEDGELFLEYRESEMISLDDGRIRSASFDATKGFGLRAVAGEAAGYAHSGELSEAALARAADTVGADRPCRTAPTVSAARARAASDSSPEWA